MKTYFAVSDIHGFYTELITTLQANKFDIDNPEHILIICGDLFDRGNQAKKLLSFVKNLDKKNRLIYIRGNHEDLLEKLYYEALTGLDISNNHFHNRTTDTFMQFVNWPSNKYIWNPMYWTYYNTENAKDQELLDIKKREAGLKKIKSIIYWINKKSINYFELGNYIFVHGWIPCESWDKWGQKLSTKFEYNSDWRNASSQDWNHARWVNGMLAAYNNIIEPNKTIVCGHWHTSYGNCHILHNCQEEFGESSNFNTYYNNGIIALDACTAYTNKINVLVLTEKELGVKYE